MGKARQETFSAGTRPWTGIPPGENPFRALIEGLSDYGICLLDRDGVVRTWNAGAEAIKGYAPGEILGQHFAVFYTPVEVARSWPQRALDAATARGLTEDEGWRVRKDGRRFWARVLLVALRDQDGTLYGYAQLVRDLTEDKRRDDALRRSEARAQQLREQVMRDPLTGAFNRRYMIDFLRGAIERAGWTTASLLVLDVDDFKTVNDRHGHDVGDQVLAGVASVANRMSRDTDRLFRLGGDEFVIYLPGVAAAEAAAIAERLRMAIEDAPLLAHKHITVSIGVAQLQPEDSAESWVQRGDGAMYEAKRAGRNRIA